MSKRSDAVGFFWEDLAVVKPPKQEKLKRQPPERTWEHPDYLPGLYEALAFKVELLTDHDLLRLQGKKLVLDIECYPNYFLAAFRDPVSRKLAYFELGPGMQLECGKLAWMLNNFEIVTFNGRSYDVPITTLAVHGAPNDVLKWATDEIILQGTQPHHVLKTCKVKQLHLNHIDLIEVAPLQANLKIYGGRIHVKRMQDLPFHPSTVLTAEQIAIVRWYCVDSDIPATIALLEALDEQLALREVMSYEYRTDLRSKSDAQVAEAVISAEVTKLNGSRPRVPQILPGTAFKYQAPDFLRFETPLLNWALAVVKSTDFIVSEFGNIALPATLTSMSLRIAGGDYRMGTGGLHSSESKVAHIADHTFRLRDIDVESFYPRIILNQGLHPQHLGVNFLRVYETIVQRRIHAKKMAKQCKAAGDKSGEAKWKVQADSLKITINGSFGKFGNMYSMLYSPDLVIQVTLSGQLSLLMLIERMELACISVVSANTDGVVMRVPTGMDERFDAVVKQWELDTGYVTEETEYSMLLSRDVNNYIAIKKKDSELKTKGAFANPWSIPNNIWRMHKNPTNLICTEAIESLLVKGVSIERTVRECKQIEKFITVRTVRGGAVKLDADGKTEQYLGKSVRWYYAKDAPGEWVYAETGNKVPRSEGAKACMELPDALPDDLDFEWYIAEAEKMLAGLGYV